MKNQAFETRRISPTIGLEINGLDLSEPLNDSTLSEIKEAFLEHHLLVFRDQNLSPAQQLAFAEAMGEPDIYPFVDGLDGFPMITPIIKSPEDKVNFGGLWHSDTAYMQEPPKATMLLAHEVPPTGGDTLFASQVAAYESLSDGMKELLAPLKGVNSSDKAASKRPGMRTDAKPLEATHPVIRTHPESGKKSLYINFGHTMRFETMTEEESQPILEWLFSHQIRPEFQARVNWRPGTLVMWDNRSCLHYPLNDYHGHRREMHRITLKGDKPS